ncbi:MAG: DUF488 family protein [Candidatus Dependentiae bacterium]
MTLFSKSIQEPAHPDDGIRICIMRKPGQNTDWHIWMPILAPPLSLHKDYQSGVKNWAEYVPIFNEEVIKGQRDQLKLLVHMAKFTPITVLCWEETPEYCHRRLIAEEAKLIDPTLAVVIR